MAEHDPQLPTAAEELVNYDRRDAKSGLIAAVSAAILALLVVMIAGVWWLYNVWYDKIEQEQYSGVASQELRAIHDREEQQLHRYAYIDKAKGVVRLPIERAIEIVAAEYKEGKIAYNTKSYPVKVEPPGGAAAPAAQTPVASAPAPASNK